MDLPDAARQSKRCDGLVKKAAEADERISGKIN